MALQVGSRLGHYDVTALIGRGFSWLSLRALHDELMKRAESQWVSPVARASTAATAGLSDDVVPLITRAIQERDPMLMLQMGTMPLMEWLRRVLREAGKLDEFRRQIGIPSND